MDIKKNISKILSYTFSGFFLGFLILIIIYLLIFKFSNAVFSFKQFLVFHKISAYLLILDFLPVYSLLLGYYIYKKEESSKNKFQNLLDIEKKNMEQAIEYLQDLEDGQLTGSNYDSSDNELFISIDKLRSKLIKNIEEDKKRKIEDDQRNWVSEGLTQIGDILRQPGENMEDYAYLLISNLVKYLEANQGGFFTIETDESDEKYFKMLACHAYNRRKFANKRIEWGDGLIGSCAIEKKTIYLTDIPENYLYITSGLGKAMPNYLLIVPLISGEELQGIIEIASFKRIEDYQLNFIEKTAESIAITISRIKNNIRTENLLNETRAQAEALSLQEARLRQNMEELKLTQEEAGKQAEEFIRFTNSVNHTLIRAEYSTEGILLYANTKFLFKMGYSGNKEVEGKHISAFIHNKDMEWFNALWERLSVGGEHFEGYMKHINKQGQDLWTMATYTCVRKEDGSVEKILFLAIDTTEHKKQSLDYESQINAINKLSIKLEFSPDGKILNWNNLFIDTLKYSYEEIENKSIFDFINARDLEHFNEIWESIIRDNIYHGQIRLFTKYKEEKWFKAAFSVAKDMYNEVFKVILIANEITNEKQMELENRKQAETLQIKENELKIAEKKLMEKKNEIAIFQSKQLDSVNENFSLTRNILDNSTDLIVSVDNKGMIVYMNKSALKFWKLKNGKEKGVAIKDIFYEGHKLIINSNGSPGNIEQIMEVSNADKKQFKYSATLIPGTINDKRINTIILSRIYN